MFGYVMQRLLQGLGVLLGVSVIVFGLVLTALGWVLTSRTAPCYDFHTSTQFAGSDARLARWIGGCGSDLGAAHATLLADCLLIAGYTIAAGAMLRRWWPLYQAPGLKRKERLVVALPFITAALDVAENVATWALLGNDDECHCAGAQHTGRLLFAEVNPEVTKILKKALGSNGGFHYGVLQVWPLRASISSAAFGPQVPAA